MASRATMAGTPIIEGGHIIGLKKGMASVSLEPGGQFELVWRAGG